MNRLIVAIVAASIVLLACRAGAQGYRNVVNTRFNTIANGPLNALIVDGSPRSNQTLAAVMNRVAVVRRARRSAVAREIALLQRAGALKPSATPGIPDLVVLRQNGRLVLPAQKPHRGPNDITFVLPITTQSGDGGWTAPQQQDLQQIINIVYPELKNVYGNPSWSGQVTVLDGDNLSPALADRPALSGGIYNVSTQQIIFAQYNSAQTRVLNLTQMMALAFRGASGISYDAWEAGMARAATVLTVRNVLPRIQPLYAEPINVSDPLYHKLDYYDWLNQPPLGNDRFYPIPQQNNPVNPTSLAGMLVPRLQMSASAWLKVAAENPSFFHAFNDAYYAALAANPNLRNNIPGLKTLAAGIVPTVEGLPFADWYSRQYVLDTSVSIGNKLYAWALPVRPDAGQDDYALAVVLVYYKTVITSGGNSDETELNGICFPIYWDYTFQNRLFLGAQYERVDIQSGVGAVSPVFLNSVGGDANLHGMMRITIDFPVNLEVARLSVAPRSMGTATAPNNFWGTIIGADTGTVRIQTENGADAQFSVQQGAFGGAVNLPSGSTAFNGIGRATITFTSSTGQTAVRKINTGYGELAATIYAADPVSSLTHTFAAGPQMVAFPIRPLKPKAADALLDPATHEPLFNDTNLLMARWRQDAPGDDKYLRYPSMDPITPGYGYWINLPAQTTIEINGQMADSQTDLSAGLTHGWNQIGNPYTQPIALNSLQFQYQADNVPRDLQTAISLGWIAAQNIPQVGQVAVWQFDPANGYTPASSLDPWRGYWIRVNVSEGLTITYPNPGRSVKTGQAQRSSSPTAPQGWSAILRVRAEDGSASSVILGRADGAADGYDARFDALLPPGFSRAGPTVSFPHPEWGANAGEYYSEVHSPLSPAPWDFRVTVPDPRKVYTLNWPGYHNPPGGTRLVLVDPSNGRRVYLDRASAYTFVPNSSAASFRIIPELRGAAALRIFNLTAVSSRASGMRTMEIAYTLSADAELTAEIRGGDGRPVRHLASGRVAPAGIGRLIWDLRSDAGISVPAGVYVLQISARTSGGQAARAVQPIVVVR
ncbi:MAG: hypothetical protein ACP5VE_02260 [Chthonomonadales bacterium]